MKYQIKRAAVPVELDAAWDSECWKNVEPMKIINARPEGSDHRPYTEFKLQYDEKGLYGLFQVDDFYVKSVYRGYQESVCRDSCVEFFFQLPGAGYFNLELNAGDGMLLYYVRDNSRSPEGDFKDYTILPDEDMDKIVKFHTMPDVVDPEIAEPTTYRVGFHFPFEVIQKYSNCALPQPGTCWRMNVYKCGDRTSHPHWITWNPVSAVNFHNPPEFGDLEFC